MGKKQNNKLTSVESLNIFCKTFADLMAFSVLRKREAKFRVV